MSGNTFLHQTLEKLSKGEVTVAKVTKLLAQDPDAARQADEVRGNKHLHTPRPALYKCGSARKGVHESEKKNSDEKYSLHGHPPALGLLLAWLTFLAACVA